MSVEVVFYVQIPSVSHGMMLEVAAGSTQRDFFFQNSQGFTLKPRQ